MKRIYLHPLPLRIWHWTNALFIIGLIATGIYLRLHGTAALKPHDPVLFWHKIAGLALISSTIFWFVYNMTDRNLIRQYIFKEGDREGIFSQVKFYLFSMFRGEENPFHPSAENRYNPLQKIAYCTVMFVLIPVQVITGLLYTDIPDLRDFLITQDLVGLLGFIHVLFAYLVVLFLIVHIYMTTLGDTVFSHTKAMISGYEERKDSINEN